MRRALLTRAPVLLLIAVVGLLPVLVAPSASAHSQLVSSDPVAGTTVRALPESVSLTFSQPLVTSAGSEADHVSVTDPMGEVISAAHTDVEGAVASTVLNPSMVMDGAYKVAFRAVSGDGHVVEGSFTFRVDASLAADSATAASDEPATGTATLTVSATGAGVPGGGGSTAGAAVGTFDIDLATSTLCYRIVTQGIPDITAAHVHSVVTESITISDEIYVPVDLAAVDGTDQVCAQQKRASLVALVRDPGRYALMLHTRSYPEGAVSGTFVLEHSSGLVLPSASTSAVPASAAGGEQSDTGQVPWALRLALAALVVAGVVAALSGVRWARSHAPERDLDRDHDQAVSA